MRARHLALVSNPASGAGQAPGHDDLQALFAQRGIEVVLHAIEPEGGVDAALEAAMREAPRALVAAGGDGTVNAVAACALEHDLPLGILPLGTLNHFARDLGIPDDLEAAIDIVAAGQERRVDVATANGRMFLNNASLGLYATIVVDRERQQRRLGRGKWSALLRATLAALREPEAFEVSLDAGGRTLRRRTPFVFVGNNDYTVQGPEAGHRATLDDGLLSVYVLHPRTAAGLLWLAMRTLLFGTSGARDLDVFEAAALEVHSDQARLPLARDGEAGETDTPVRFAVRPRALRVFAPAADAPPAARPQPAADATEIAG